MAKRTGGNVSGDLNELKVTELMLDHGVAVNGLTASDTGWDLHCHVPDGLFRDASKVGTTSWALSGRTVHIQVKTAAKDDLRVGTVRGWMTGTVCGTPTFMFGMRADKRVFSAPSDLDDWLLTASQLNSDEETHRYVYDGSNTALQTKVNTHQYTKERFPAVLQLWVRYPHIALAFPSLTGWMNHDEDEGLVDPRDAIVQDLASAVWADAGYGRYTDDSILLASLAELYGAAGVTAGEERTEEYLKNGTVLTQTLDDGRFTRDVIDFSIARVLDNRDCRKSAVNILEELRWLWETDASRPRKPLKKV